MSMRRRSLFAIALILLCAPSLFALNVRSAVSIRGVDTNPCTPLQPCRTFTAAIAATSAGGEVVALDSAGYGPFTISAALAVLGAPGVHAAITATTGAAISVTAASSDSVIVKNLVLVGAGGADGIVETSAKQLTVLDSLIRGFAGNAIRLAGGSAGLLISNCTLVYNNNGLVQTAGGANQNATVQDSRIEQNDSAGLSIRFAGKFVVTDTTFSFNDNSGINLNLDTGTGVVAALIVKRCTLVHSGAGVRIHAAQGNTATAALSQNVIGFNDTGIDNSDPAVLQSYGNNRMLFNRNIDIGVPSPVVALQ